MSGLASYKISCGVNSLLPTATVVVRLHRYVTVFIASGHRNSGNCFSLSIARVRSPSILLNRSAVALDSGVWGGVVLRTNLPLA